MAIITTAILNFAHVNKSSTFDHQANQSKSRPAKGLEHLHLATQMQEHNGYY